MTIRKILVVDDSELIHRMFDLVLLRYRQDGTTVMHARNGADALAQLRSASDIDLMLLDVNMPVMGGVALLQNLKPLGRLTTLKVIMVSTEGHEADVQHALALGATAYVTKPFHPSALHALIETEFGKHLNAHMESTLSTR